MTFLSYNSLRVNPKAIRVSVGGLPNLPIRPQRHQFFQSRSVTFAASQAGSTAGSGALSQRMNLADFDTHIVIDQPCISPA
jgi:hypothetical protein